MISYNPTERKVASPLYWIAVAQEFERNEDETDT
jgi:hypothetical protein